MTELSDKIKNDDPYYDDLVLMSDIYEALIGKKICVYTKCPIPFGGTLEAVRDGIIAINLGYGGMMYMSKENIIAIVECKETLY